MTALSEPTTITVSVAGLIALIAILALLRVVLRRTPAAGWRRYRVGLFVERDPSDRDEPQPPR